MTTIVPQYIVIGSIDIGRRNMAHYVERCLIIDLIDLNQRYTSLPVKLRRRVKGPMNSHIEDMLTDLYRSGERISIGVDDICTVEKAKGTGDPAYDRETRLNLLAYLEKHRYLWDICDIIVIEQQYFSTFTPKGRRGKTTEANVKAIKVGEGVIMWFLTQYPMKDVCCFGSQFKTQLLGSPNSLTKYQRKKWAIEKAKSILNDRGDTEILETFKSRKQKLDDVSDALIQCQAYKLRHIVWNEEYTY